MSACKKYYVNAGVLDEIRKVRAGIIPYIIDDNGDIYFMLARDRRSSDLSDFGGGVHDDETTAEGAIREWDEESGGIFPRWYYSKNVLKDTFAIINDRMALVFLPLPICWKDKSIELFRRYGKNREVNGIKWVTEDEFIRMAFNKRNKEMWGRIQNFLISTTSPQRLTIALNDVYKKNIGTDL